MRSYTLTFPLYQKEFFLYDLSWIILAVYFCSFATSGLENEVEKNTLDTFECCVSEIRVTQNS